MAEPMEMPFGIWIWMSARKQVLDGVQISAYEETILRSKRGLPRTYPDMSGGR